MKIAVTYEDGQIFQHFGHTQQFKVYDIQDNKVVSSRIVDTMGQGHGALAMFLMIEGVNVLICGGIGMGAQNALRSMNIALFDGVSGDADAAVEQYLNGSLEYDPNAQCSHHDHACEEHDCSCDHQGCSGNHHLS